MGDTKLQKWSKNFRLKITHFGVILTPKFNSNSGPVIAPTWESIKSAPSKTRVVLTPCHNQSCSYSDIGVKVTLAHSLYLVFKMKSNVT